MHALTRIDLIISKLFFMAQNFPDYPTHNDHPLCAIDHAAYPECRRIAYRVGGWVSDLRGAGLMSAENTAGKQRGRPFQKGQSGNPDGRPNGSRNATTLALETLLDGQATALTQKAIDVALTGDIPALRLCLDRILPPRKDSPVAFDLPEMKTLNDAVPAMGALVKAVGQGDLTPTEAGELTKMVQAFAKIIETAELEERVRKLEEAIDK